MAGFGSHGRTSDYLETPWQVEKQVAYVTDIEG